MHCIVPMMLFNTKPLFIPIIIIIAQSHSFLPTSFSQNPIFKLLFADHYFFFSFSNRLMDSPKVYLNGLKTSVTLILIISLTLFPSISVLSASVKDGKVLKQKKLLLGSRPPKCVNKCSTCKPCMAALVISPHHRDGHIHKSTTAQRDEGYYLLSWKCKCGNKFFQP